MRGSKASWNEFFFNLVAYGKGTANSKVLSYPGLGETEKMVFFSIMPDGAAQKAMAGSTRRCNWRSRGKALCSE